MSVEFWKNLLKLKQEEEEGGKKQEEEKEPEKRNLIYVDIIEKEKWGIGETASLLLEFDWNDDFLAYVAEWENFRKSIYLEGSTFITLSAIDHLSIYKMIPNNIFSEKEKERIIQETNRAVTFEMDKGNFTIITIKIQTPYYGNNLKLAKEGREKISKDWEYLNFLATNFENYVNKLIDDRR